MNIKPQDNLDKILELNNLATTALANDDHASALHYSTRALKIAQDSGDKVGECAVLLNRGHIMLNYVTHEECVLIWLQAYRIAKQIGFTPVLEALEEMSIQLRGEGLEFWETLSLVTPKHSDD